MYRYRSRRRVVPARKKRRVIRRVRGRGSYWNDIGRGLLVGGGSALGTAGGALIGGPVGGVVGGVAGSAAGEEIASAFGLGAYSVKSNSLMLDEGAPVPAFGNLAQATVVSHREYIKDIVGPATGATFTLDSFPINPGNPKTFPWLSQIARVYDEYAVLGMIFEFKSTASDSLNTGVLGLGTVMLATDYDAADDVYSSKIEMENSQYCTTTKPACDMIHPIECDPSVGITAIKYVRSLAVPSGKDIRLYDHGTFELATQGLPNNAGSIGELWVTYQVAFYKPQFLIQGGGTLTDSFTLSSSIVDATKLTVGGVVQQADAGSSIGGTIQTNTYSFPSYIQSGTFMLMYTARGASSTLTTALAWTSLVGGSAQKSWDGDTIDTIHPYPAGVTSSTLASDEIMIKVTSSPCSIALTTAGTLPGTITFGNLFVFSVDPKSITG